MSTAQATTRKRLRALHKAFDQVFLGSDTEELPVCIYYCGNARLDDLAEHLGFELEADGIDTIGGLVFNRLGYLPSSGARVEIPRLEIIVQRTGRKRIEELLLQKTTCLADDEITADANGAEGKS